MKGKALAIIATVGLSGCTASNQTYQSYVESFGPKPVNLISESCSSNLDYKEFDSFQSFISYAGDDLNPKGEMETTSEYNKRTNRFHGAPVEFYGHMSPSYNPDSERLNYKIIDLGDAGYSMKTGTISFKEFYPTLLLGESIKTIGSYKGTNAYGATADVLKNRIDRDVLVLEPRTAEPMSGSITDITVNSYVPLEEARQGIESLEFRVRGILRSPYIAEMTEIYKGTIDNPTEREIHTHYIRMDLCDLTVFNPKTGEAYDTQVSATR